MGHESEGGRESSFKSGTRPASLQAEMRQRLCCRGLSSLALVVALIGLAASDTVECSRPEAGGERVVGVAHVIERNGSQSNSTTPSSERPDDDFEKFCRFIKETTETTLNSRANQTLRELMGGQVERRRGFELELSILSKQALSERIEADRMNVSYEGEFDKGRETRLVIMHNDTTILVARIYTKYYYWKVRKVDLGSKLVALAAAVPLGPPERLEPLTGPPPQSPHPSGLLRAHSGRPSHPLRFGPK